MDKNKIIEGAAKLVAKGAYDKAIKEYQKVLDADPKDVRVLQKMGELFQKKNENAQAAHYFTKVAESYSSDGFFLKAVALYKQVLKLNPNLVDVNLKLAELHQQLGLMSEAMAYYQVVANHYDKSGDTKSSLDTLKKMVDLDPDNVASRIKLGELYAREGMNGDALPEFKRAAEYLKRNNRTDDYLRVAERIATLEPENHALSKELAASYLQKGDQKRALARLQVCFKADPKDLETLNLLAQAFHGLGQTSKTISVYKELAKIHVDRGEAEQERRIWDRIKALDPDDAELHARFGAPAARATPAPTPAPAPSRAAAAPAPAPAPTRAPAPAPAPAPAAAAAHAPAPSGGGSGRDQLPKLLTETDVYVKYGLHDKALEHLRKIFSVDPENLDAHEKAYQIYVAANNGAQAFEQLLNVLRLCTRRAEVARAQPYLATILQQNPGHPEVPAFLAVLRSDGAAAHVPRHEPQPEDAILVDSNEEEIIVAEAPEDALAGAQEDFALRAASETANDEDVITDEGGGEDSALELATEAPLSFGDGRDEPLTSPGMDAVEDEEIVVQDDVAEVEEGLIEDEPRTQITLAPVELEEEEPADRTVVVPIPTARTPAPQPAKSARPGAKEEPKPSPVRAPAPSKPAPAKPAPVAAKKAPPAPEPPAEEPAAEECDEASFFLDQGLLEEAREILETIQIAYPGHVRGAELMARLEELESQGGAAEADAVEEDVAPPSVEPVGDEEGGDAFGLAQQLADELGDLGEADATAGAAGDDFQYSVDEVFSEFKKGLEKVVKPEDVETHYDLGIAYKEMGLIDDAVGEFQVARQGCIGKKKEIDCLTMLALLLGEKGEHGQAIDALKEALASEHATGDVFKALSYELGNSYVSQGEQGKALYHFERVAKQDGKYRDVAGLVSRLSAQTTAEEDPVPAKKAAPVNGAKAAAAARPASGSSPAAAKPSGDTGKTRKVGYV